MSSADVPAEGASTLGHWTVRRRWVPRHRPLVRRWGGWRHAKKSDADGGLDFPDFDGDDLLVSLAIVIGMILFVALAWFVFLPLLLAVTDIVVVALLLLTGVVGKVIFRRPWVIEAVHSSGKRWEWSVIGWRRSTAVMTAVRHALANRLDANVAATQAGSLPGTR